MRWYEWVLIALTGAVLVATCLCGCGSTTDRQTKIVEKEEWVAGPMVVDTWVGQATVQPTRVVHQRTQDEVEKTDKTINMPDPSAIITAASSGTPWGGIIATAVGLLGAFAGKKAIDATRQRNELIDGVERAKDTLPDGAWFELKKHLEAEQNSDTKAVVKARTA